MRRAEVGFVGTLQGMSVNPRSVYQSLLDDARLRLAIKEMRETIFLDNTVLYGYIQLNVVCTRRQSHFFFV